MINMHFPLNSRPSMFAQHRDDFIVSAACSRISEVRAFSPHLQGGTFIVWKKLSSSIINTTVQLANLASCPPAPNATRLTTTTTYVQPAGQQHRQTNVHLARETPTPLPAPDNRRQTKQGNARTPFWPEGQARNPPRRWPPDAKHPKQYQYGTDCQRNEPAPAPSKCEQAYPREEILHFLFTQSTLSLFIRAALRAHRRARGAFSCCGCGAPSGALPSASAELLTSCRRSWPWSRRRVPSRQS